MGLLRGLKQRSFAHGRPLRRQVQMGFERVLTPLHGLVFVDVDLKGILCGRAESAGKTQRQPNGASHHLPSMTRGISHPSHAMQHPIAKSRAG